MDNKNIIMNILKQEGLDKRLEENPETRLQILNLMCDEIINSTGRELESIEKEELIQIIRNILNKKEEQIDNDGIRHNSFFSINEDGTLEIKLKSNSRKIDGNITKLDTKRFYSIGKKTGQAIVSEKKEYTSEKDDISYNDIKLSINIYNPYGLEMCARSISQNVTFPNNKKTNKVLDDFCYTQDTTKKYVISPVIETCVERAEDLIHEYYINREYTCDTNLKTYVDNIMEENKNKEIPYRSKNTIWNPIQLAKIINCKDIVEILGRRICFPPQDKSNYLGKIEIDKSYCESQTNYEIYKKLAEESVEFKKTLFNLAKRNSYFVKKFRINSKTENRQNSAPENGDGEENYK